MHTARPLQLPQFKSSYPVYNQLGVWMKQPNRFLAFGLMSLCLVSGTNSAENERIPASDLQGVPGQKSVAGGVISVRTVDPLMPEQLESQIWYRMQLPWKVAFRCGNLAHVVNELNKCIPTEINRRSLEEIGLTNDTPIDAIASTEESILATLVPILRELDLTWTLKHGRLTIETVEAADENLVLKVYDVTPLVVASSQHPQRDQVRNWCDTDSLLNLLQATIAPDSWEALGGCSTIVPYFVADRCLFCIATLSPVHADIENLLNEVNRMGLPDRSTARVKPIANARSNTSNQLRKLPKLGVHTIK